MRVRISSRLVSNVCSSPTGSSLPSRPCSGLLPKLLVAPLVTESPILAQIAVLRPRNGGGRPEQR